MQTCQRRKSITNPGSLIDPGGSIYKAIRTDLNFGICYLDFYRIGKIVNSLFRKLDFERLSAEKRENLMSSEAASNFGRWLNFRLYPFFNYTS